MARKVKCLKCDKFGTNETYFKGEIKGKSRYFCNEFEYDMYINEEETKGILKRQRNDFINWIVESYYNYEPGMIFPTTLSKRLNPLFEFYPLEVVKESFEVNAEILNWAATNKDFNNEFSKTCYIMKIVESSINDCYNKYKSNIKIQVKPDVIVDYDLMDQVIENTVDKNNNDISSFLD